MASNVHPFALKLPLDLFELLRDSATENERSLQREIVFRLRRSFIGEVASAETRERAGAVGLSPAEEQIPAAQHDRSPEHVVDVGEMTAEAWAEKERREGPPLANPIDAPPRPEPPSLPDYERRDRHDACLKRFQHHIYHGGRPCPLCGYPA